MNWTLWSRASRRFAFLFLFAVGFSTTTATAVQIPGLYNTGVDDSGVALGDQVDDPHYNIVVGPLGVPMPDETLPNDFPIPPWLANNAGSRWIGPDDGTPGSDGNADPGTLLFETQFDMTGLDPNNAAVVGWWGTDNVGQAILLNGISVPVVSPPGFDEGSFRYFGFNSASAAAAGTAFGDTTNVLHLHVENAPPGFGPAGLRVDRLYAEAAPLGSVKIPGLFNTGVDDAGVLLADGAADPHYALVSAPENTVGPATALAAPPSPPWAANTGSSRWIGPNNDASGNGPEGVYVYETTFDLSGLDPATAVISGLWSLDNTGDPNPLADIRLNGEPVGVAQVGSFPVLTRFDISSALGHTFQPGLNTLTFTVTNAPASNNPTGLRVEGIVGYAYPVPEPGSLALVVIGSLVFATRRRRTHSVGGAA